ncbi:putative mucin/carbohydrate-binding domain-containing protein [Clostridium tarantellae]|uniref:Putative mucin/carbohydrate-binding domain-containing protein n=1 Tax=Clostridium tarantellae TaxID=39493 RepID=A0A6I1MI89_9CLOT|nr:putative mucin/carbohydrate-binding domain-containing protein [Clostridium tarantellae]MPQ42423.1 hypothetical protein [Clostridium tarantellae]
MSCKTCNNSKHLNHKINLKKKLTLPCNKPNMYGIKNVNVTIDILGSKVISTPLNEIVKKENLNLAKERLLIAGWICIKIYYYSSYNSGCINNAFFKMPFNTYIPLNKSASCCKDKFSINSCVKNVCVTLCNCRTFEQKFTLFLEAKKIGSISPIPPKPDPDPPIPPDPDPDPPVPPLIEKLPNAIIINNNNFLEIAKVEFNSTNKILLITSKNLIADSSLGSDSYFSLVLRDNTGTIKISSSIISNRTANDFANILNNIPFEYGDILELNYLITSRFLITNFPVRNENYVPTQNKELYIITPNGFIPYIEPDPEPETLIKKLPNSIIINSDSNKEVSKIEFNISDKTFIVTSEEEIPDASKANSAYFVLSLNDFVTSSPKASSFIMADEISKKFKNDLTDVAFEFFDTLQLNSLTPENIKITNFPEPNETYTLKDKLELITITPNGLTSFNPTTLPPPVPTSDNLPNTIIIQSKIDSTIAPLVVIIFNIVDKKLSVAYTDNIADSTLTPAYNYFSLKLKDSTNENIKVTSTIVSNKNAENFANTLNDESFDFNDILELEYSDPSTIVITNYPNEKEVYTPINNKEFYRIDSKGLVSYIPNITPSL